jgi:hypothetical protein
MVKFYEPSEVTIFMEGCKLRNSPLLAQRIFDGATKDVCAWVDAKEVTVVPLPIKNIMSTSKVLHFNPKVLPYWNSDKLNIDNEQYVRLFTSNRHIIKGK